VRCVGWFGLVRLDPNVATYLPTYVAAPTNYLPGPEDYSQWTEEQTGSKKKRGVRGKLGTWERGGGGGGVVQGNTSPCLSLG